MTFIPFFDERAFELLFTPQALALPPEIEPIPTVQETLIDHSEVNAVAELVTLNAATIPVNVAQPFVVVSPDLVDGSNDDTPVGPPVFFPTLLPELIKSVGDDVSVSVGAPLPLEASITSTVSARSVNFSNVDLGLAGVGVSAILLTGLIALVRR